MTQILLYSQHPLGSLMVLEIITGQDLCLPGSHMSGRFGLLGAHLEQIMGPRTVLMGVGVGAGVGMGIRPEGSYMVFMRRKKKKPCWLALYWDESPQGETTSSSHADNARQGMALQPQLGLNTRLQRSILDRLH